MIWRAKGVEKWERERIGRLKWDSTDSYSMYWIPHIAFISSALRRVSSSSSHLIIISPVIFVDIIGFRFAMTRRRFAVVSMFFILVFVKLAESMSDARRAFPYPTSNSIVCVQTGMSNEKHATHSVIFVILDSHFCVK